MHITQSPTAPVYQSMPCKHNRTQLVWCAGQAAATQLQQSFKRQNTGK